MCGEIDSTPIMHGPPQASGNLSLRILLVNDEVAILQVIGELLRSWGHQVHTFVGCSEETAPNILQQALSLPFDLAIIDAVMPGLDGMELTELFHRISPSTYLISSDSGACLEISIAFMRRGVRVRPLLSPFSSGDLQEILQDAILERTPKTPDVGGLENPQSVSSLPRGFGKYQVCEDKRLYPRHCSWCSREIPARKSALVVRGLKKSHPRFCSEDCFRSWESIYWQRIAIGNLRLSLEEFRMEQKDITRQKHILQYR